MKNFKLKRLFASLLLLLIIISCIPVQAFAATGDSNSRRRALINLASGSTLVDVNASENIDEGSLRTVALFLSNFYEPFHTILDKNYKDNSDEEDSPFRAAMYSALVNNCGFDSTTADFLINFTLTQSLTTCHKMYVKETDLKKIWDTYDAYEMKIGFSNFIRDRKGKSDTSSYEAAQVASLTEYASFDGYKSYFSTVELNNTKYIHITYPIFLAIMNMCYEINSYEKTYAGLYEGISYSDVYNISNRYKNNIDNIPVVNFYYIDSANEPHIVFSSSEECLYSYLMLNDKTAYQNTLGSYENSTSGYSVGYGASLSVVDLNNIIDSNDCATSIDGTYIGAIMYVNWVGDLILDNGVYRTIVLPGCANPHMLTNINTLNSGRKTSANSVPTQNIFAMKAIKDNRLHKVTKTDEVTHSLQIYSDSNSLLNQNYLRIRTSESATDLDTTANPFGKSEKGTLLIDALNKNSSLVTVSPANWENDGKSGNHIGFQSFGLIRLPFKGFSNSDYYWYYDSESTRIFSEDFKLENSGSYAYLAPRLSDSETWFFNNGDSDFRTVRSKKHTTADDYFKVISGKGVIAKVTHTISNDDCDYKNGWCTSADHYFRVPDNTSFGYVKFNTSFTFVDTFTGYSSDMVLSDVFPTVDFYEVVDKSLSYNTAGFTEGRTIGYNEDMKRFFQPLFITYCFAYFNKDKSSFDNNCIVDLKMNVSEFPNVNANIDWASLYNDTLADQVLGFAYYILHPSEGGAYFKTWIKTKVSSVLLGTHEDIVGGTNSNSSTGMTKYLGTAGYTSVPNLSDIEWMSKIINIYDSFVVYIITIVAILILCYVVCGSITTQKALISIVLFGVLILVPPRAINAAVDVTNTISSDIYNAKFDYWAMCQLQQYLVQSDNIQAADTSGDMITYASLVIDYNAQISNGEGGSTSNYYAGVKLKWMTPKRYSSSAQISSLLDNSVTTDATYLKSWLLGSINKTTSGESYVDSDNALYLYRDYIDIYRTSSISYNGMLSFVGNNRKLLTEEYIWGTPPDTYKTYFDFNHGVESPLGSIRKYVENNSSYETSTTKVYNTTSSIEAIKKGFLVDTNTVGNYLSKNTLAYSYLMNYNEVPNILASNLGYLEKAVAVDGSNPTTQKFHIPDSPSFKSADHVGMSGSQMPYNYGLPFTSNQSYVGAYSRTHASAYRWSVQNIIGLEKENFELSPATVDLMRENLSYYYYALYAESPFYYFDFNLRDQVRALSSKMDLGYSFDYGNLSKSGNDNSAVTKMFLTDNQSYFFNLEPDVVDGYGELRDFMNMHDFFYYILPSMRPGVDLARLYDKHFGLYIDEDCSVSFLVDGKLRYNGEIFASIEDPAFQLMYKSLSDEQKYKFWHSYNTYTILLGYCPWLDTMFDCEYAESETIKVADEEFKVVDPLDPTSYFTTDDRGNMVAGRYMVFSRSEMAYYGLEVDDLTTVEYKIIKLQDTVYEKALDLMNYFTLSDETMIQAFSMLQLFEFNKEFSQTSPVNDGYVLYPQGYELKAFSYDAYLRMIVAESSGEALMTGNVSGDGHAQANSSIYETVMDNTSLFFGVLLVVNDFIAVYVIPVFRIAIIFALFIMSFLMLLASVTKLELNFMSALWKSLLSPLLQFSIVSIALSFVVSLFMSDGANGVVSNSVTINLGDPTATVGVMIVVNIVVIVFYFKILKKCIADLSNYVKAVFSNIGTHVVGAVGVIGNLANGYRNRKNAKNLSSIANNTANTAEQRGIDNSPRSGKSGLGTALIAGATAGVTAGLAKNAVDAMDGISGSTNKYDKAISDAQSSNSDIYSRTKRGAREANIKNLQSKYDENKAISSNKDVKIGDRVKAKLSNAKTGTQLGLAKMGHKFKSGIADKVGYNDRKMSAQDAKLFAQNNDTIKRARTEKLAEISRIQQQEEAKAKRQEELIKLHAKTMAESSPSGNVTNNTYINNYKKKPKRHGKGKKGKR